MGLRGRRSNPDSCTTKVLRRREFGFDNQNGKETRWNHCRDTKPNDFTELTNKCKNEMFELKIPRLDVNGKKLEFTDVGQ